MTNNPIQTLRLALIDLMDAEGGEPGESKEQRRAWRAAEAALRATKDGNTLRDAGIALIKAANVADPDNRLIVASCPAGTDLSDGILRFAAILAGTDWTDKGTVTLGQGARKGGK